MDRILKEYDMGKSNLTDCNEKISFIIYIAGLNEDNIVFNDIDSASKVVYHSVYNMNDKSDSIFESLLKENDQYQYVTLDMASEGPCKVYVSNILRSNSNLDNDSVIFLTQIIRYIIKYTVTGKPSSIYLLRTLLFILTKRISILTSCLSLEILECMNKVALSSITWFKQYARDISKIAITMLSTQHKMLLCDIDLLPVRGIDMCDIVKLFSKSFITVNIKRIIRKVLQLFSNNTEGKDGAFLYGCCLFYSFESWKNDVWPLFSEYLKQIEYEGEFFQGLIKYWIPMNICEYKNDFYLFLRKEPIDNKLKAYILLESKRKGYATDESLAKDILLFYNNIETVNLGLKIISTFHKKTLYPQGYEVRSMLNYLYLNLKPCLDEEEVNCFNLFLSQLFLYAHCEFKKTKENFNVYVEVIEDIHRFCYRSLKTNYFEVGAQIMFILWNIATSKSHQSLKLSYRLEKRDFYKGEDNLLYIELRDRNLWKYNSNVLIKELMNCFIKNSHGPNIAKLLSTFYLDRSDLICTKYLRDVVENEMSISLQSTERIKNISQFIFKQSKYKEENTSFLEDVVKLLSGNLSIIQENIFDDGILYNNTIFLEIIIAAKKNKIEVPNFHHVVEECLDTVVNILEHKINSDHNYKTKKVFEAFLNGLMHCIIENKDILWININKAKVIRHLVIIIQKSNMKKPVSLSVEVLKNFGSIMEETEVDTILKLEFINATLKSLHGTSEKLDMKIRRNPESRLVLHAMLCSERNANKPLLKWVLNFLLDVVSDPYSSDASISSALHSIEILVSDNSLQIATLPFIYRIIVKCVELFGQSSWIIRNADLQLAKALIERMYGVSLNLSNRPKNIDDLFILFPDLMIYFFKILSLEQLDERAVIVFQFFFESQVRDHAFAQTIPSTAKECFLPLFTDIIKKYGNNYGKLAVRSYTSLCIDKFIPNIIWDITDFLKSNFVRMKSNIFANFVFLLQELYDKYRQSFYHSMNKNGIKNIYFAIGDLLIYLRKLDRPLFNLLLLKIKPLNLILDELPTDFHFQKRLWLNNYVPFLIINTKPSQMSNVLNVLITEKLLSCMQIKILSILVARLENKEFDDANLNEILDVLFQKSLLIDDSNNYLLNCYFKTILLFYKSISFVSKPVSFKCTNNLYKLMIIGLYFSSQKSCVNNNERENFYRCFEAKYVNSISINEEIDNDIMCILSCFKKDIPATFLGNIFKLVFYFATRESTYLEAYNFMSLNTGKSYCSILNALIDFLSVKNLVENFKDENLVAIFLTDVHKYINNMPDKSEDFEGYYSVESDNLIPKMFLKNMLQCNTDNR